MLDFSVSLLGCLTLSPYAPLPLCSPLPSPVLSSPPPVVIFHDQYSRKMDFSVSFIGCLYLPLCSPCPPSSPPPWYISWSVQEKDVLVDFSISYLACSLNPLTLYAPLRPLFPSPPASRPISSPRGIFSWSVVEKDALLDFYAIFRMVERGQINREA